MIYPRILIFLTLFFVAAVSASAQTVGFYPLHQVQPGQRGYGKTVFKGSELERFEVEILGILKNNTPRQIGTPD